MFFIFARPPVVQQYEKGVVFVLGKITGIKEPTYLDCALHFLGQVDLRIELCRFRRKNYYQETTSR